MQKDRPAAPPEETDRATDTQGTGRCTRRPVLSPLTLLVWTPTICIGVGRKDWTPTSRALDHASIATQRSPILLPDHSIKKLCGNVSLTKNKNPVTKSQKTSAQRISRYLESRLMPLSSERLHFRVGKIQKIHSFFQYSCLYQRWACSGALRVLAQSVLPNKPNHRTPCKGLRKKGHKGSTLRYGL
jgi:hypothetical protein